MLTVLILLLQYVTVIFKLPIIQKLPVSVPFLPVSTHYDVSLNKIWRLGSFFVNEFR